MNNCKLIYRASRDGFGAQDFHRRCDGVPDTLTVIKATSGNIFGGFTQKSWRSSNVSWITDENSFIFSLVNKENKPFKAIGLKDSENGIYSRSDTGPSFGSRLKKTGDIQIVTDSDIK